MAKDHRLDDCPGCQQDAAREAQEQQEAAARQAEKDAAAHGDYGPTWNRILGR